MYSNGCIVYYSLDMGASFVNMFILHIGRMGVLCIVLKGALMWCGVY